MIWRSENYVKQQEAGLDKDAKEELKNNKVSQGLDMLDKVLQLTESGAVKKVTKVWKYIVSLWI